MTDSNVRTWARSEITAQLEKILNSPEFKRNRSASAFLTFVVDETLEGRGPRLKAFTVAMAVFNRDVNFDPQNNSIVRVQAARLRQLLQFYFAGSGSCDPIRVTMPPGGYAVEFDENPVDDQASAEMTPAAGPAETSASLVTKLAPDRLAFASIDVGDPAVFARAADRPTLVLSDGLSSALGASGQALRARLRDAIERGAGAFDHIVVLQRLGEAPPQLSYSLITDGGDEDNSRLWFSFKLFHDLSGALIWSRAFPNVEPSNAAVAQVAIAVVRAIADVYGAINSDAMFRSRSEMENPRGYFCVRAAFDFIKDPTPKKEARALRCLEAEFVNNPDDARISSLLSDILIRGYLDAAPGNLGPADLRRAAKLARRAYNLAPQRAQPVYAIFMARFYDKSFDDAFAAANKALEINPNSSIMTAQIGAAHIARGHYERGEALLAGVMGLEQAHPSFLGAYRALVACMRDNDSFDEICRSADLEDSAIGLLLQIVSGQKTGDAYSVDQAEKFLREKFPGVAADIPATLDRHAFIPEIRAKLLDGLAQAALIAGPKLQPSC
jgi:tetratricopeptide (TPR) repeat protein